MDKKKKNSGFKVPENYFGKLSDKIQDKLAERPDDLPEAEGFAVPDGYFEGLNARIMERLNDRETKVISMRTYRRYFYAAASVAAAVLIVIGLQWEANTELSFSEIASMELETYLDENNSGISSYELAEVLIDEETDMTDLVEQNWDEENIVDYLDESIDDIDELNLDYDE